MLEKTISELVVRFHAELWPDLPMRVLETERSLASGRLDIVFVSSDQSLLVLELKNGWVTAAAVRQVSRYVEELKRLEPARAVRGMVAAPSVSRPGLVEARQTEVLVRKLDMQFLESRATALGLPVAHGTGHRPRLRGTSAGSRSSTPGQSRKGTPAEIVDHLRSLHDRFPPGTITAATAQPVLEAYWRQACPAAAETPLQQVVELTAQALAVVPGSALGVRTQSRSRGWATVRAPDGRVVASMEARASRADVSFYALQEDVDRLTTARQARLWGPRGYSFWLDSYVGQGGLQFDEAIRLLKKGAVFEFQLPVEPAPEPPAVLPASPVRRRSPRPQRDLRAAPEPTPASESRRLAPPG